VRNRFRVRAKAASLGRFLLVGIVCFLAVLCMELYRMVVPFVSANPLWTQVTIGEPVIDEWNYGGLDEEGYLRFYNKTQSHIALIPPEAHMFDADGKFVILEGHTASSLTFAQPYEAIPTKWALVGAGVIAVPVVAMWLRLRQRRRRIKLRTKGHKHIIGGHRAAFRLPVKSKSFRRKRWPWA
jgi:hypothetical protein